MTVREKDTGALASRTQMALIGYAKLDGDVIKDVNGSLGETKAAVKGLIGNEVSFDGTTMKKLTGDTVYMYYDSSKTEADEIGLKAGELQLATKIEGIAVQNVKYILDGSDVDFILIDVKNKLNDATATAATLTPGTLTNATAAFKDTDGNAVASGTSLKAGDTVNVVITATGAADVDVTVSNAVISGQSALTKRVTLTDGQSATVTVVIGEGAASITCANHT